MKQTLNSVLIVEINFRNMEKILNYELIRFDDFNFSVKKFVLLIGLWAITFLILRLLKSILGKSSKLDQAKRYSIYTLFKYVLIVITSVFFLQIIGFNLSVLMAGSAALLVGLGLGIQNLFSDYISGIIILFDSTVKVGDVIEADGLVCKVEEINLRTTKVLTRDDKYVILPNTILTKNQLINWTHHEVKARFEVNIGVAYGSDIELTQRLLIEATCEINEIVTTPKPSTRLVDFGDSSIKFIVLFWTEEVFRVENVKSLLRIKIIEKLTENNIVIPYPQRVIHTK